MTYYWERKIRNNPLPRHSPQAPLQVAVLITSSNKMLNILCSHIWPHPGVKRKSQSQK